MKEQTAQSIVDARTIRTKKKLQECGEVFLLLLGKPSAAMRTEYYEHNDKWVSQLQQVLDAVLTIDEFLCHFV